MGAGSASGLKNFRGAWQPALRTQRGGRAAGRARHPRRPLLGRLPRLSLLAGAYFDCRCAHDEFGAADVVAGTPSWSCVLERKKAAAPRLTATAGGESTRSKCVGRAGGNLVFAGDVGHLSRWPGEGQTRARRRVGRHPPRRRGSAQATARDDLPPYPVRRLRVKAWGDRPWTRLKEREN